MTTLPARLRRTLSSSYSRGVSSTGWSRDEDLSPGDVEGDRPDRQRPVGVGQRTGRPPEEGADPGPQLGQPEGLGQVVVGALLERRHPIALVAPRRQDQDRRRRLAPDVTDDARARRDRAGRGRAGPGPAGGLPRPAARRPRCRPRRPGGRGRPDWPPGHGASGTSSSISSRRAPPVSFIRAIMAFRAAGT